MRSFLLRVLVPCASFALAAGLAGCGSDETDGASGPTGPSGPGASASTGAGGAGGGAGGGGAAGGAGGGGSGGAPPNCDGLAPGPLAPVVVTDVLNGSEDFAFDGKGHIVGKQGGNVVLVDAQGMVTDLANLPGQAYGLRYHNDGNLIVALPSMNKLVQVTAAGEVSDFATGLGTPNGIYPDFDGNVWVTEFSGDKVTRIGADMMKAVVASGPSATAPNGVVLDPTKTMLFYTEYQEGIIRRVDLDAADPMPVEVAALLGTALDGLALDACGNIYAVDQQNSDLYRVQLDADGVLKSAPELLASFPQNVANAQFGSGAGFDPSSIYLAGNPGTVYSVPVGVPGAAVPTPP